jgi:hypothetical protein
MRGIAVIDKLPGAAQIAVWVTSRDGVLARSTNAVVIDAVGDPEAEEKVRSLTRCCAVLATEGTTLEGLPIVGEPLSIADVAVLLDQVEAQQARILEAITDYKRRTRSKALIEPRFPARPKREDFTPSEDTATQRAFTTANFVGMAWSTWLKTDDERRRRTQQPKTGKTPWIMPAELNSHVVPDFPDQFAAQLHEQELV